MKYATVLCESIGRRSGPGVPMGSKRSSFFIVHAVFTAHCRLIAYSNRFSYLKVTSSYECVIFILCEINIYSLFRIKEDAVHRK